MQDQPFTIDDPDYPLSGVMSRVIREYAHGPFKWRTVSPMGQVNIGVRRHVVVDMIVRTVLESFAQWGCQEVSLEFDLSDDRSLVFLNYTGHDASTGLVDLSIINSIWRMTQHHGVTEMAAVLRGNDVQFRIEIRQFA
ncbi:hypothetical protein ACFPM7_28025 [Actinokineospora guangxiensis]|uniref:Uncharacterized protein n=1 Tax=Actinokineospora guangxiensis TaxID=1490288 RepID=A0ABW0EZB5_9PSEU